MNMNTTHQDAVAGFFDDRADAERAVSDLRNAGFSEYEIDLAPYHGATAGQYAGTTPFLDSASYVTRQEASSGTTSPVGADSAAGLMSQPGMSLASSTGGYLVTATGSRAQEARAILQQAGADVGGRVNPALAQEGVQRLQLREEQLTARKQQVQAGEVLIHKDVIAETQSVDVPVMHEELVITRHPVTNATASMAPIGQDNADIVVPLSREEAVLEKQTVVREEVEVGKRQVTETQHLTDTVRREEARIENTGDLHVADDTDHRSDMLDSDEVLDRTSTNR